ncbi:hypothetical protein Mapa_018797 [Marchantia paleacea]|nr:hypothetical protein Mapa_018797 [Marchantia paleacea]
MDQVKYPVLTEKTIRLLEKNQYSFDVNIDSNKTEIKKWIELFFNVKVISVNSFITFYIPIIIWPYVYIELIRQARVTDLYLNLMK